MNNDIQNYLIASLKQSKGLYKNVNTGIHLYTCGNLPKECKYEPKSYRMYLM